MGMGQHDCGGPTALPHDLHRLLRHGPRVEMPRFARVLLDAEEFARIAQAQIRVGYLALKDLGNRGKMSVGEPSQVLVAPAGKPAFSRSNHAEGERQDTIGGGRVATRPIGARGRPSPEAPDRRPRCPRAIDFSAGIRCDTCFLVLEGLRPACEERASRARPTCRAPRFA
jgi:hypothetical protein